MANIKRRHGFISAGGGGGGGETNTSSYAGSELTIVKPKSGVDLPFKGINPGNNILGTSETDDVLLDFDFNTGFNNGTAANDAVGVDSTIQAQNGGVHSALNPYGGDLILLGGAKGSGGSGAPGKVTFPDTANPATGVQIHTDGLASVVETKNSGSLLRVISKNSGLGLSLMCSSTELVFVPTSFGPTVAGTDCGATGGGWSDVNLRDKLQIKESLDQGPSSANTAYMQCEEIAAVSELVVEDSSGNRTVISPHAIDAPSNFYDRGRGLDTIYKSFNRYTAEFEWRNDALGLSIVETRADYITRVASEIPEYEIVAPDVSAWEEVQEDHQSVYDGERERIIGKLAPLVSTRDALIDLKDGEMDIAVLASLDERIDNLNTRDIEPLETQLNPVADIRKPKPAWLA